LESWPIHEAKARLSELVKRAQRQPQQLTSHGQPVAVVLSCASYHRHQHEGESLVEFIRRSPLAEVGEAELDLERNHSLTRELRF
jgi:prevent-host-death family protein